MQAVTEKDHCNDAVTGLAYLGHLPIAEHSVWDGSTRRSASTCDAVVATDLFLWGTRLM